MPEADMNVNANPELTIVAAGPRELTHVVMLAHRIWPVAYDNILTPEQIRSMLLTIYHPDNLVEEIEEGHQFYVAYLDHLPVGYASAYRDETVIWLKKLYVDPSMHKKRIGARLMHAAVTPFLPADEIRLLVNQKNTPAQDFYARMGFSRIGETPVRMGDFDFVDYIYAMPLHD